MFEENTSAKIKIKKNPDGDTRTARADVTREEFHYANICHIIDVKTVMDLLIRILKEKSIKHDFTKLTKEDTFYKAFKDSVITGSDFKQSKWYLYHINQEAHHPNALLHPDFNLLDLLETICDCVCAGLTRTGEMRPLEIDEKIVNLAIKNTVQLILDNVEVVSD